MRAVRHEAARLFNNPEILCFDAKFSSECFVILLMLENVAFANVMNQLHNPQTPWGYMVK